MPLIATANDGLLQAISCCIRCGSPDTSPRRALDKSTAQNDTAPTTDNQHDKAVAVPYEEFDGVSGGSISTHANMLSLMEQPKPVTGVRNNTLTVAVAEGRSGQDPVARCCMRNCTREPCQPS